MVTGSLPNDRDSTYMTVINRGVRVSLLAYEASFRRVEVHERAKSSAQRVLFVIDEAHYLMGDATSLSSLQTAVRHSRHYDLSIQFITQTGGEFALTPEARTFTSLCSLKLIHRVDEAADRLAEWFGLTERGVNWVRSAKAGNEEDGYSEALLGVDEVGWFPLRVRASEYEVEARAGGESDEAGSADRERSATVDVGKEGSPTPG